MEVAGETRDPLPASRGASTSALAWLGSPLGLLWLVLAPPSLPRVPSWSRRVYLWSQPARRWSCQVLSSWSSVSLSSALASLELVLPEPWSREFSFLDPAFALSHSALVSLPEHGLPGLGSHRLSLAPAQESS